MCMQLFYNLCSVNSIKMNVGRRHNKHNIELANNISQNSYAKSNNFQLVLNFPALTAI